MNIPRRISLFGAAVLALAGIANSADAPGLSVTVEPVSSRKPAPQFALQDSSGKTFGLKDYSGKVMLLDFWATWCTGCKLEIPWFSQFQETYGKQGLAVVGVSLDEEGWTVLRPFLTEHQVPYTMLLGDDPMARRYGIEAMPDTFLIDRKGRVAAAYRASLVNKDNVEANIKALLAER